MRSIFAFASALVFFVALSSAATVSTEDGLSLKFKEADASVAAVSMDGAALKLNGSPGGFYVVDMIGDKLLGKMDYRRATQIAAASVARLHSDLQRAGGGGVGAGAVRACDGATARRKG